MCVCGWSGTRVIAFADGLPNIAALYNSLSGFGDVFVFHNVASDLSAAEVVEDLSSLIAYTCASFTGADGAVAVCAKKPPRRMSGECWLVPNGD